jgi:hypothetical protein
MHEIVTLQFGRQSNYLGTHFWNTQVRAVPQHDSMTFPLRCPIDSGVPNACPMFSSARKAFERALELSRTSCFLYKRHQPVAKHPYDINQRDLLDKQLTF